MTQMSGFGLWPKASGLRQMFANSGTIMLVLRRCVGWYIFCLAMVMRVNPKVKFRSSSGLDMNWMKEAKLNPIRDWSSQWQHWCLFDHQFIRELLMKTAYEPIGSRDVNYGVIQSRRCNSKAQTMHVLYMNTNWYAWDWSIWSTYVIK